MISASAPDGVKEFWCLRNVYTATQLRTYLGRSPTNTECIMAMAIRLHLFYQIINPSEEVIAHYQFYTL